MIAVEGLTFKYPGRKRPALRDVSFAIAQGETLLVLGPSGCGKSTLALCLNGAIPHFVEGDLAGRVQIGGTDTRAVSMAALAQRVGIVFQDPETQFCMLTVEDEVAFGLENLAVPRAEMDARIDEVLAAVGLADRRGEQIAHLSGGQKQRLALACVLVQRPEVLVFDEPTAQLDPAGAAEVIATLDALRAGGRHTLIIVEHRLDAIMHLVDRVLVLGPTGTVLADGGARAVLDDHGEWLREQGIWIPHVAELAFALRARGAVLRPFPLTVAEAAAAWQPARGWPEGQPNPLAPFPAREGATALAHGGCIGEAQKRTRDKENENATIDVPASCTREGASEKTTLRVPPSRAGKGEGENATIWVPPSRAGKGDRGLGQPLLSVRHLNYQYPNTPRPTLNGITFDLHAGEFVAIVGANGAGKSTLARLIVGLLVPPAGTVMLRGQDITTFAPAALARQVGYVFQYPEHQFVASTALDDVAYGLLRAGVPAAEARARAQQLLDVFGLGQLALAHPFTLSHGEQRRLSVAAMLALDQAALLLDEPTFGQDRRTTDQLLGQLADLVAAGRTVVAITHDMRLVAEWAQRALVLADGALIFDGPPDALFADAALVQRARLALPPLGALARQLGLPTGGARVADLVEVLAPFSGVAPVRGERP